MDTQQDRKSVITIKSWSRVIAIVALLVAIISAAILLLQNRQLQQQFRQFKQSQQLQQRHQQQLQHQLKDAIQQLQLHYQKAVQQQGHSKGLQASTYDWMSALYLTKMAQYQLQFQFDNKAAKQLLQSAQQSLQADNSAMAIAAKHQLQHDIATLNKQPQISSTHLYQLLMQVNAQIDKLPTRLTAHAVSKSISQPHHSNSWRDGLAQTWQSLKGLIVIRHDKQSNPALITPQKASYLKQNLHQLILHAQAAALNHNNAIYHMNIVTARQWIQTYCQTNQPAAQQTIALLNDLSRIDVQPAFIDLQTTIQLLQKGQSGK